MSTVPLIEISIARSEGTIPPKAQEMVDAIGRLLVNCGAMEYLVKGWIFEVEPDKSARDKLCNNFWGKRSTGLKKRLQVQKIAEKNVKKYINAIDLAKDLMQFRNSVAHGACMINDNGEALIYDTSFTEEHPGGKKVSVDDIKTIIDQSADLYDELYQHRIEFSGWRIKNSGPCS